MTILIHEAVSGGGMVGRDLPPSWLEEGSAIRRAVAADFRAVPGVEVIETVDARCLDDRLDLPGPGQIIADPARPIDLARLARLADLVVIVAPESGGELEALARLVEGVGGRSLGSTPEAIALCSDKSRMADHLVRLGIPTPPTWRFEPASGLPRVDSGSGRVVVKPVDGAGAIDTFVVPASDPCPPGLLGRGVTLIQPFRPGMAMSASFLVGLDGGATLLAVGRQRVEVGPGGEVHYRGGEVPVPLPEALLAPARRAVESVPGLLGFVGVDFLVLDGDHGVEVLEINPRLTTSIVGLVRLAEPGVIALAWVDLAVGSAPRDSLHRLRAIQAAPPVRFRADGSISDDEGASR